MCCDWKTIPSVNSASSHHPVADYFTRTAQQRVIYSFQVTSGQRVSGKWPFRLSGCHFICCQKQHIKKKARSWRWCCCKQTGARVSGTLVPSPFIREHQRIRGETHAGGNRLTRRQGQCNRSILLNKTNRASATHSQEIRRRKERTLTRITHIKKY